MCSWIHLVPGCQLAPRTPRRYAPVTPASPIMQTRNNTQLLHDGREERHALTDTDVGKALTLEHRRSMGLAHAALATRGDTHRTRNLESHTHAMSLADTALRRATVSGGLPCTCSVPRRASFKCAVCNASFPHARCIHAVASARYARLLINANKSVQNDGDSPVCKAARNGSAGAARYANHQSCAREVFYLRALPISRPIAIAATVARRASRTPRLATKDKDQARQDQACLGALESRRCALPWPEIGRRSHELSRLHSGPRGGAAASICGTSTPRGAPVGRWRVWKAVSIVRAWTLARCCSRFHRLRTA